MLNLRQALLGGVATCAIAALAQPARAEVYTFDIPAQSARTAIPEFGRQSGIQILASQSDVGEQSIHGLKGDFEPREALRRMLEGTSLRIISDDGRTVTLAQAPQSGSAAGDGAEVEALIVTAQKREEDIQDVPIAISAFTQEDLERSQIAGGPDLMTQVPNFTFTKTNFSSYSIQIRGIGTQAISATVDPAVAIAFNNTSFIRNRFFEQEFYDLQRVEVLRGPQGTLYGRNATAGVVNIISAKPSFNYEAKLSADVANYNSTRLEGMINIPLVEDRAALRIAGAWTKREGYSTNQITDSQIDGRDLWSTRVSLRVEPTDRLSANLIWEHFEEDDDRLRSGKQLCHRDARTEIGGVATPGLGFYYSNLFSQGCLAASLYSPDSFEAPNGHALPYYHPMGQVFLPVVPGLDPYVSTVQSNDLRVIESTVDPEYRAETDVVELQLSFDISEHLTLTSETAWLSDDIFSLQDYNRFNTREGAFNQEAWDNLQSPGFEAIYRPGVLENGVFCDPQIGCSSRVVAVDVSTAQSTQFSQEFRLSSDFEGAFNFSVGGNFLRYDTMDKYYLFINTLSMMAAISPYNKSSPLPAYVAGVSDNHECLRFGMLEADPRTVQQFAGCTYMDPNPIGSLNDQGHNYFLSKNPYKLISYAMFGEAYYQLADNLKLTGGLRWTVDRKEAPRIPSWVLGSDYIGYPVLEVEEQEWREPTGRLTLDWKPLLGFTDETLLYASIAHGYKAGGSNPPATGIVMYAYGAGTNGDVADELNEETATHPKTFKPEFVNAFEVGSKNTLLDGALTLNLGAFYYDYEGYQISQIVDRSAVNLNFDAQVWGVEVEADWRPLENLRLGFKGGYENTRVADGSKAIDLMDRTGGNEDWVVVRPFPTFASNCILPVETLNHDGVLGTGPNVYYNGNPGPCEFAYLLELDPVTALPYVPNPTEYHNAFGWIFPGYEGFDPEDPRWNDGAGFFKDLSGNELPNAPHFTATITADYTVPLPNDWLATLHTDLYYQSEAWTRIFNVDGYDKLKAYTNVNIAAIFTNEDAGWKVMAYVKNVFDRDSITGAFLNSDDTGLTTNVFLTEPRLFGLRVTKDWSGGPWWTGASPDHTGPFPLTVELGGQVQRHDAPYTSMGESVFAGFSENLHPNQIQNQDLDWGDGREIRVSYAPAGADWRASLGARFGKTNGTDKFAASELDDDGGCAVGPPYEMFCDPEYNGGSSLKYGTNYVTGTVNNREEHMLVDFMIGKDVGLGFFSEDDKSMVSFGARYADLNSHTRVDIAGVPGWDLAEEWLIKYDSEHHRYDVDVTAERDFRGVGPAASWEVSKRLLGDGSTGRAYLDWSVGAGVLFGRQKTVIQGQEADEFFQEKYTNIPRTPDSVDPGTVDITRTQDVRMPVLDLGLGLSYEIQRLKVSAGYRWERYFDAVDAGYTEGRDYDRTIDGPYFKIAVGFGG